MKVSQLGQAREAFLWPHLGEVVTLREHRRVSGNRDPSLFASSPNVRLYDDLARVVQGARTKPAQRRIVQGSAEDHDPAVPAEGYFFRLSGRARQSASGRGSFCNPQLTRRDEGAEAKRCTGALLALSAMASVGEQRFT